MRKPLTTIAILLIIHQIFGQELIQGKIYTIPASMQEYSIDMVYNKITDKKNSQNTLNQLVERNPNLYLERVYDENGKVIRYYYDPNNQDNAKTSTAEANVSPANEFPPFSLNTLGGKRIQSEDLRGKLILLRFELHGSDYRFKKHEIAELDNQIDKLDNKDVVKAIIIFREDQKTIEKNFPFPDSNFELVADGMMFFEKYRIKRSPMTALIDQNGNLVNYFDFSEDIILESFINN